MSWLYRNSAAWRGVVHFTRQGALNMALFSLAITAVAWYGGTAIMERYVPQGVAWWCCCECFVCKLTPTHQPWATEQTQQLYQNICSGGSLLSTRFVIEHVVVMYSHHESTLHVKNMSFAHTTQMLARANKERLAVLLDEVKGRSDNSQERYAAALR